MRVADARARAAIAPVAVAVALAVVLVALAAMVPATTVAKDPPGMSRFMYAVAQVESGGRYDVVNAVSGAYGKYQIMPANWPGWAGRYLGNRSATPTALNQEIVAHGKFQDLHRWLGAWRQVAYWWLAGRDGRSIPWSPKAKAYVAKVMAIYGSASARRAKPIRIVIGDRSFRIAFRGGWSSASAGGYSDGVVRWSRTRGATATLRFAGSSVAWIGPVGPTRGRAIVRIDGAIVRTVDLRAPSFAPRRTVFATTFAVSGPHILTIQVLATPGRPYVAIDELVVRP